MSHLEQILSYHSYTCIYINYQILDCQNKLVVAQGTKRCKTKAVC